jgi:hypothetical protein
MEIMKRVIIIYDDLNKPQEDIRKIVGNQSFADVIYKKKTTKERLRDLLMDIDHVEAFYELNAEKDFSELRTFVDTYKNETTFLHFFSNYVVVNPWTMKNLIDKCGFVNDVYRLNSGSSFIFDQVKPYHDFIDFYSHHRSKEEMEKWLDVPEIEDDFSLDISSYGSLIQLYSNSFETRFFNSIESKDNLLVKVSTDVKKIEREYNYYYLLPDHMKFWYVQPFNLKQNKDQASYEMERLNFPDLSIRWVHGAIDTQELKQLLNKIDAYLWQRETKDVALDLYERVETSLFVDKVVARQMEFKETPYYSPINEYIKNGTDYDSIDDIIDHYLRIYKKYRKTPKETKHCIGHGDLCFSNILYSNFIDMLRLIDPKGASGEGELWTNPYYDIAKLSHSICGNYDLIINGLFTIEIDDMLKLKLTFKRSNEAYIDVFKEFLEMREIEYKMIRIYEVSLFLSMLALHAENQKKLTALILNAIRIMEEIEHA